ncbi:MAG: porin [Zoogloeaceae bacterium]|nr:porin [Zoogloeaceae bacterium]
MQTRFAVAAVAATLTATSALAQSNVTIYGLIDLNLVREWSDSSTFQGVGHSELNGSRWGLKGDEDLGGGNKALFVLESGYSPADGSQQQGGRLFGRQSFVGLQGGWGRVTIGRQYSPAFSAIDSFDATGSSAHAVGLLSRKAGAVRPAYETRFDNMVKYRTPNVSGFEADLAYWWGQRNTSSDSEVRKEGDGGALAVYYRNGPIAASAVTQHVYRDATGGKVRTSGLGFSYDFGPAKAYLAYTQDKESGSQGDGKARTYDISAEIKAGDAGTVAVSYANRNEDDGAAGEDAYGWSLYYMHALSKRTTAYAGYSKLINKDDANYGLEFMTPPAGEDPQAVMLGMRHKF